MRFSNLSWCFAIAALTLSGCDSDPETTPDPNDTDVLDTDVQTTGDTGDTTVDEFAELTAYMAANAMDLPDLLDAWIVDPQAVFDAGPATYFIIDIRGDDKNGNSVPDFQDGHITGAHSVAMADVVTYEAANNTGGLPVLVVCYTGQTAGHAVASLRLSGVDAQVLKWGMSGWHSDFDVWTGNLGDAKNDHAGSWSMDPAPALGAFDPPMFTTGATTGADILAARIDGAVLDGFNAVGNGDVLGAHADYQIVNFWADTDYLHYGHITGAYQIAPGDLTLATLGALDPNETIVIYCWTGQTSSMTTAWLNVLGYDAVSLKFGANGMIHNDLTSHTFPGPKDFAYET